MDFEQKTGSGHSRELGHVERLVNMRIPELIYELRAASRPKQFDQVEEILVAREAQLKGEAAKMGLTFEFERRERKKIEGKLEECQKQCEKMKMGADLYEKLLANVKKYGLEDTTVEELRAKNIKLEREVKMWKGKFLGLNDRILKMESKTQLLMKEQNMEGDNGPDPGVTLLEVKTEVESDEVHVDGGDSGNDNADPNLSQRKGHPDGGIGQSSLNPNKDESARERLGKRTYVEIPAIIEIEDSDNDDDDNDKGKKEGTSQFVTANGHPNLSAATAQRKSNIREEDLLGMLKRKYDFSQILQRCPAYNTTDKRSKP